MKIAVPTMDGKSISAHFGRSPAFLVFDMDGLTIKAQELRENAHLRHGQGGPHGSTLPGEHGHGEGHGHLLDHGGFVRLLGDCQAVISRGMGPGAAQALGSAGIRVWLTDATCSAEEAATRFASGQLQERDGASCGGHAQP